MQLERLIAALAPTDVVGGAAVEIRELAYDAREVPRSSLFFCIPGAKADGHEFAPAAVAAGSLPFRRQCSASSRIARLAFRSTGHHCFRPA